MPTDTTTQTEDTQTTETTEQATEQHAAGVDLDALADKIAARFQTEDTPKDDGDKFEDLDYDEQIKAMSSEIGLLKQQQAAMSKIADVEAQITASLPEDKRDVAKAHVAGYLREIAAENPAILTNLNDSAREKIADMALGKAMRTAKPPLKQGGETPDTSVPHAKAITEYFMHTRKRPPTAEELAQYSKEWKS